MGPFIFNGVEFSHGCMSVHRLYEFKLISQISHPLIWLIWLPFASCAVDLRTYSQFQMVCRNVLWHTWEIWMYACTETVLIGIEVTNVWCTFSILMVVIWILDSWCTDVQPISNGMYICIMGYLRTMAVRLYRKCTNRDWGHKCSMHVFNPFGQNLDSVQVMYGRTSYFKYFELAMYGPIHFLWGTIYPRMYASTSTVWIWIDITNVQRPDLSYLITICILYSWCMDVYQFQMVGTYVL